ncbi:Glycosyltransferase involved in cell wall bisynthesis [Lentibacillus persicus]|uniref:Glycosyltransferase involved in cell wall bisynthesis n=1 Tax=Lentibacillus persicus TaxID=640948 RepID=A0A1I1U8X6_9BACI|nr:glycosyltransferase [Lentibacillus persicus]SFD67124.1 Glycosyltransferase involved in cell wall bisynthesis [Lentibacillus persicus]
MNDILITSFDMEVGGVERSLISMLRHFDYSRNNVDLMLYSHSGELFDLLPAEVNVLEESKPYKTFRMPIDQTFKSGKIGLGAARLRAKYKAMKSKSNEPGYRQMQWMWKYGLPYLPKLEKKYDVAISYLWPHYTIAEKVEAETKIAWVHTDFSTVDTDAELDREVWDQFDYIAAVSKDCRDAFITKYSSLQSKAIVIENITSPDSVRELAEDDVDNPMTTDKRFKLITVARLSHAKGIDQAVIALKMLKDKGYDDFVWYVVGYGGDEAMLRALISESGLTDNFILLGKKTNPYPYIKSADLYVQPSRYEGKAVTVGEAQILAKPVLITNYPTAKSQVIDGYDGVICHLSAEGIASGIERLYKNAGLRRQLAENCSRKNFHNRQELEKLYELIREGAGDAAR